MTINLFTWSLKKDRCIFGSRCDADCDQCSCYLNGPPRYETGAPDNPDINGILSDLGITSLSEITPPPLKFPQFCRFVPMIKRGDEKFLSPKKGINAIALPLGNMIALGKKTCWLPRIQESFVKIRSALGKKTLIILVCNGKDKMLKESFWPHRSQILSEIKASNPDLVVTTNFSTLENQPPMEDFISIYRNQKIFGEMRRSGIKAIPLIYWKTKAHLDEWAEWLNNSKEALVCLNLQTNKGNRLWEQNLFDLQYLLGFLKRKISFLIIVGSTESRINELKEIFGDEFIVVQSHPMRLAVEWRVIRDEGKRVEPKRAFVINCLKCIKLLT